LRLLPGIDLQEQARAAARFVPFRRQGVRQFGAAQCLDHVEQRHGVFDFVGLQGADQVQLQIGKLAFQSRIFRLGFLHPVFAEQALAGDDGFANPFLRHGLGHRHQAGLWRGLDGGLSRPPR